MTNRSLVALIEHGGALRTAAARYAIPLPDWLDISTGINPHGWPVGAIPQVVWARLPEEEDGLHEVMRAYFGTPTVQAVAGSQSAIEALPHLRPPGRVGVRMPTYSEHAKAWQKRGHTVVPINAPEDQIEARLDTIDVLVVVNPNNPTGEMLPRARLLRWHERLSRHDGWLIVDEAFVDADPDASVARHACRDLIVLRSLGKFWGLAGARLGFVLAASELLAELRAHLGPWHVSHPARWLARAALADHAWIEQTRARLYQDSDRLGVLLRSHGLPSPGGCPLFRWARTPDGRRLFDAFAHRGVLIRALPEFGGVRFGLPGVEHQWRKLEAALGEVMAGARS